MKSRRPGPRRGRRAKPSPASSTPAPKPSLFAKLKAKLSFKPKAKPAARPAAPEPARPARKKHRGQEQPGRKKHRPGPARPPQAPAAGSPPRKPQPQPPRPAFPAPPPHAPPSPSAPSPALPWREAFSRLIAQENYQPLDQAALARKVRVPPAETDAFAAFLAEEEQAGRVMRVRHGLYILPKRLGFSVGHLQMNERGFGFLVPIDPAESDFYIAGEDTATALHGDLVLARLKEQRRHQRDSRLRGEVVKVLQRKRRQLVGTLERTQTLFYVRPDETRIPYDITVPPPAGEPPLGQKVVVELKDWPDRRQAPEGVVTEVLGAPDAPGVDLLSIIRKHDLPTSFPEAVEQEAADIAALIPPEELARREDFRAIFTLTIDPDDAKDFDDALSFRAHPNGDFEIFVHIADVSHYVRPGTALDREAVRRGNSVYLVDRVIPMLPEKLSNGICSLQPHVDRLVKTAVVTLGPDGTVRKYRFAAGVIHSAHRFTYQEAFALLQRPPETPLARDLHALHAMAQRLRRRRFAHGALELDFPEVKVRIDTLGIPTHLERMENDVSHQLIEEFMLLANEVVALELKRRDRPGLYRVHENPDPERLEEFRAQAKSMGFPCGDLTKRGEIQKLLDRVRGQPGEGAVKIGLLRSLKRAMYSPKPAGHYGLSKINYTHFTSPIRRYADLVVHRVLFEGRDGRKPGPGSTFDALSRLALHLSNTERTAADAEQESVKLKKLEYFQRQAEAAQRATFQALVLEVRASGLLVQIPEFVVQGLVPLSGLEGDLFVFHPQRLELQGRRTHLTLRAGLSLPVEVAQVDLARGQIDFRVPKAALARLGK